MTIQCFGCHSGSNAGRHKGFSATAAALLALLSGGFSSMALAAQPVPAELKLAIGSEPTEGFDPLLGWSHGSYLLLHSPLLKQNADLSWQNVLTQAVTPNQDGKGWLIRLKPDLTFSNGAPLTAEDVAFTYNSAAQGGGKIDMGNFVSAKVLSPTEVAISLSAPRVPSSTCWDRSESCRSGITIPSAMPAIRSAPAPTGW
ncbi:nickel/di-oligopepetide ABC transporter substrate-binding protein [Aeromonas hydrophila]|nr:nickel/di-oligopepetide ABC transporter substrate-binding protein [Aeromonas hydrophila]